MPPTNEIMLNSLLKRELKTAAIVLSSRFSGLVAELHSGANIISLGFSREFVSHAAQPGQTQFVY
jgi:hypothetical protein